jgi:hypothetical protein
MRGVEELGKGEAGKDEHSSSGKIKTSWDIRVRGCDALTLIAGPRPVQLRVELNSIGSPGGIMQHVVSSTSQSCSQRCDMEKKKMAPDASPNKAGLEQKETFRLGGSGQITGMFSLNMVPCQVASMRRPEKLGRATTRGAKRKNWRGPPVVLGSEQVEIGERLERKKLGQGDGTGEEHSTRQKYKKYKTWQGLKLECNLTKGVL